jgi:hypothetical protein
MNNAWRGQTMEARMSDELAQSDGPRKGNSRGVARNLLHALAGIGAAVTGYFWRRPSANVIQPENRSEYAAGKARLGSTAVQDAAAKLSVTESFPAPITADVIVGPEAPTDRIAHTVPDDQEIRRRRDLVRTLFNDFWSGANDKPAAFVDRLAEAEPYINERLTAWGEFWQLDAETRTMLGLPSTKKRANPRPS